MENFYLERFEDVNGRSGVGIVAQGTVFDDGSAVLRWLIEPSSIVFREGPDALADFRRLHGHGGRTKLRMGKPPRGKQEAWKRRNGTPRST